LFPPTGGPASLPIRAHVSFALDSPPRLIFVGVTDRPQQVHRESERIKVAGRGQVFSVDFWASLPSAIRIQRQRSVGPILPWALPLAGFWALDRAFDRARPQSNHQPPGITRAHNREPSFPNPLMGLWRPSLQRRDERIDSPGTSLIAEMLLRCRRPYSVLMGPMPCRLNQI